MRRVFLVVPLALALAASARAQDSDPLHDVRALYEAAAYEDALNALDKFSADTPTFKVEQYRAFCLIALGRMEEATTAVTRAVTADPLLLPSASDASPRVRAVFTEARRKLLPDIARDAYAKAKAAYVAKSFTDAASGFKRVVALIDAAGAGDDLSDLRMLAQEFLSLSTGPAVTGPVPPLATRQAGAEGSADGTGGADSTAAVRRGSTRGPVTVRQRMPVWTRQTLPPNSEGLLRIKIDEQGNVSSAIMARPTDPVYDIQVLEAAKQWKYEPALSNGRPVPSEKEITFLLKR